MKETYTTQILPGVKDRRVELEGSTDVFHPNDI